MVPVALIKIVSGGGAHAWIVNLTIKNIMLGYLSHRGFTCVAEILELTNGIVQEDELGT